MSAQYILTATIEQLFTCVPYHPKLSNAEQNIPSVATFSKTSTTAILYANVIHRFCLFRSRTSTQLAWPTNLYSILWS